MWKVSTSGPVVKLACRTILVLVWILQTSDGGGPVRGLASTRGNQALHSWASSVICVLTKSQWPLLARASEAMVSGLP